MDPRPDAQRPLEGVTVIELGQLVAGPFAGQILAWFGAKVIKVERPGGDPIRGWRAMDGGTSLWWRSLARNKACVTADLRRPEGRALARRLIDRADALIENFRPGRLEAWGLGPDALRSTNPDLIVARISGYGQTGPDRDRPGYASACEAAGGLRHLIGEPGGPSIRPNLSLGDSLAGLHAALGVAIALVHRLRGGGGQDVDVALTEAVFNMLESVVPEHDRLGLVRQPSGGTITGVVPSNTFRCGDGKPVVIGANTDAVYARLCAAIGRPEMATDPRLATNAGRVAHQAEVEAAIGGWVAARPRGEVLVALEAAEVPVAAIRDAADLAADPQLNARGMFEVVDLGGRPLRLGGMCPRLSATPGRSDHAGRELGADNRAVYLDWLGMSEGELAALAARGVI